MGKDYLELIGKVHIKADRNGITAPMIFSIFQCHTFVSIAGGYLTAKYVSIVDHSKNMYTWHVDGHDVMGKKEHIADWLPSIFDDLRFNLNNVVK